jgi:hypothetical protein
VSAVGDMKAARNARERVRCERPQLSILPRHGMVHQSRGTEYGADKYARGNYFGPPPATVTVAKQILDYVDAAMRHLTQISQAMNVALGTGGDVKKAFAVPDLDASGGFPPSMLPHFSHALAGLGILAEIAVANGFLPADPGQPWKEHPMYQEVLARRAATASTVATSVAHDPADAKADPDAERRRVEKLTEKGRDLTPLEKLDEEIAGGFGDKLEPRGASGGPSDMDDRVRALMVASTGVSGDD